MKKIIIFYGTYGGGHLSAAKSIKEYIEANYSDVEIQMIDCVEYINKYINKITTTAYSEMAKKVPWAWGYVYKKSGHGMISKISNDSNKLMSIKLDKLINNFNPDYVISTHPFSSQMCAYIKEKHNKTFKLATIMTDYAIHDQWIMYPDYVDYFFVAHAGMKKDLISNGIQESKIHVTGIPLSSRFLEQYDKLNVAEKFNINSNTRTLLFFGGGEFGLGKSTTIQIFKTLVEDFPEFQIVAISGKNKSLKEHFEEIVKSENKEDSVKVLDYTNMVPELMSISDLVITKPGGLTTTESLSSGLPIIVINPIPGQEEENAEFLEKNNVGIWIKKDSNIKDILNGLLNNSEKLNKMKSNALMLSKKNSTADICKTILG